MLNASAKAFVPGGGSFGGQGSLSASSKPFVPPTFGAPQNAPPAWFRYQWESSRSSSMGERDFTLQSLFGRGTLRPFSQGGNSPNALSQFFADHFDKPMNTGSSMGIVISRSKMPSEATPSLLDMAGFIISVEAPTRITPPNDGNAGGTPGVNEAVNSCWDECFNAFGNDHRVQAMCHVSIAVNGSQHHYIYIACVEKSKQIEVLSLANISSRVIARHVSEIPRAMSVGLSPQPSLGAVIVVGENFAALEAQDADLADKCVNPHSDGSAEQGSSISCTISGLAGLEAQVLVAREVLVEDEKKRQLVPFFVTPEVASGPKFSYAAFFAAAFRKLVDMGLPAVRVVVADTIANTELGKFALDNFPNNTTLDLNISHQLVVGDNIYIPLATPCDIVQELTETAEILKQVWSTFEKRFEGPLNTVSQSRLKSIPRGDVRACRRAKGARVVLVVEAGDGKYGRCFLYCPQRGNTLLLPNCWSNPNFTCSSSAFAATLTTSTLHEGQYRLVIDDVLMFNGTSAADMAFGARWRQIESNPNNLLEDDMNWPHASPCDIVILRAAFQPLRKCHTLAAFPHPDQVTCGLTLVHWDNKSGSQSPAPLVWTPAESVVFRFRALSVENVEGGEYQIRRVALGVSTPEGESSYNDEFADFLSVSAPTLKEQDVVECMLRRAHDGAHWWEVVGSSHGSSDLFVDALNVVETAVNDPVVPEEALFAELA